jgi:outer membrane protein assembly factor BamB
MGLEDCRFDVTRTETTLKLEARGIDGHAVGRAVRFGSLALLVLWPAAFAIFAPDEQGAPLVGFLLFGFVATIGGMIHATANRIFDMPALGRVRRSLLVETSPEDGVHRRAPTGPRITIDGQAIGADERPRVMLSTIVVVMWMNGVASTSTSHHVSMALRRRLIRVEDFKKLEAAVDFAKELAEALGVDPGTIESVVDEPIGARGASLVVSVVGLLAGLAPIIAGFVWAVSTDRFDGVAPALVLAGIVTIAVDLLLQEAVCHFFVATVTDATRETYGIEPIAETSLRGAWVAAGAWVFAAIGVGALMILDAPGHVGPGRIGIGGDRIVLFDVDGDGTPEPLLLLGDGFDTKLVALDARTGQTLWYQTTVRHASQIILDQPPLVIGSNGSYANGLLGPFDPKTGVLGWTAELPGLFLSVASSDGCLVVHSDRKFGGSWTALDSTNGKACPLVGWTEPPPALAEQLTRLAIEQHATVTEPRTDSGPKLRALSAGDVSYVLERNGGKPERLTLTASRGATRLWTTRLDAGPIIGMPFSVAGDNIVVAGLDLRGAKRLRLVGIDTSTGAIRYVKHHPVIEFGATDVALSGGVALVAWASDLRGYDATTGKPLWTTGAR